MMASVVCLSKIIEHYDHARQKHPYFCDWVSPTGPGMTPEEISKNFAFQLSAIRAAIMGETKNGTLGWDLLLNCEVWEVFEALASGNNEQAEEELYDCVAILLRVIDVLRGRQHLGKKFPSARCGRDNKKGTIDETGKNQRR